MLQKNSVFFFLTDWSYRNSMLSFDIVRNRTSSCFSWHISFLNPKKKKTVTFDVSKSYMFSAHKFPLHMQYIIRRRFRRHINRKRKTYKTNGLSLSISIDHFNIPKWISGSKISEWASAFKAIWSPPLPIKASSCRGLMDFMGTRHTCINSSRSSGFNNKNGSHCSLVR